MLRLRQVRLGLHAPFVTPLHIPVVHACRVHLHRRDLISQIAEVLVGHVQVPLGCIELLAQQLNGLVNLVRKHHVGLC